MKRIGKLDNTPVFAVENVVVGSGAAGFNAACLLKKEGLEVVLLTEGVRSGTSRNTGSDKQTYYKLSLSGNELDSVRNLAGDLYNGKCVDGDIALVEASLSSPSFLRLADLGVPFPTNRYGEYIGYKTDHDPYRRATSAGPYTSRFMTECLEKEASALGLEIQDNSQLVKIITRDERVRGAVFIDRNSAASFVVLCNNLVLATGGPAGIYGKSVYPVSQFGATGLAFEAGCKGKNLTEWQYGLASLSPRWNVSGSYMQVLPRFVSVDENGNEYDFLSQYPAYSRSEMLSRVFLKGYQWPFDVRKLEKGSSIVDILCLLENEKGRRVYLDYMHNPDNEPICWDSIDEEARQYLYAAKAVGPRPIDRLKALNLPAYSFYLDKGVDLEKEYLEIGLCAQHNNGGLSINSWWESNVSGLFPVGECAASHGVYRPGGSALNAGQCGSRRAAMWIGVHQETSFSPSLDGIEDEVKSVNDLIENSLSGTIDAEEVYQEVKSRMSLTASALRNRDDIMKTLEYVDSVLANFDNTKVKNKGRIWLYFQLRNALITQKVYLFSMIEYIDKGGKSRGSSIYSDKNGLIHPSCLDSRFSYSLEVDDEPDIQEVQLENNKLEVFYRKPNPIPSCDKFFENVWRTYRENRNIY